MDEEITETERVIERHLATSALGPSLARQQESIAQRLTEDQNLTKLTEVYKGEPESFSLEMHLYDVLAALRECADNGDDIETFEPPPLKEIVVEEFRLRDSLMRKGRRELVDMTRILERGEGQRSSGFAFWRRGGRR